MQAQAEPGLRQRKKNRTRERLVRAAYQLFGERGYDAVTVDEIAAAADVSRRTFFRYFSTKEAVLFAHQPERLATFRRLLAAAPPEVSGYHAVRDACLELAHEFVEDRETFVLQHRIVEASPTLIAVDRAIDLEWEEEIQRALLDVGVASGGSSVSPDEVARAGVVAGAIAGVIRATLRAWLRNEGRGDLIAMGRQAFALLEAGADGWQLPSGNGSSSGDSA